MKRWYLMSLRSADRFDFEQGSFSPPTHVDNFFYIRYPKLTDVQQDSTVSANQAGYRSFNQVLNDSTNASATNHTSVSSSSGLEKNTAANIKDTKNVDFSKHPLPCQPFISSAGKQQKTLFYKQWKSWTLDGQSYWAFPWRKSRKDSSSSPIAMCTLQFIVRNEIVKPFVCNDCSMYFNP